MHIVQRFITLLQHKPWIVILFLAFCLRILLFHTEFLRTSDSVEYANVAENLATGNGFTKTLKVHFFDEKPVIASGTLMRPMFTPLVYAVLLRMYNNYYFLQFFNIVLSSVVVLLCYFLAKTFYGKKFSAVIAFLIALNPNLIIESRFLLSEELFYCLVLAFFLCYFHLKKQPQKYIVIGVLSALAYLTRIEGVLLLVTVYIVNYKQWRSLSVSLLFFLVTCLPNFILNGLANGNPFYSFYWYHFSIFHFSQGQLFFYHPLPSPLSFIVANWFTILKLIIVLNKNNLISLFGLRFLGLLALCFLCFNYKKNWKDFALLSPLILFALLFYAVQGLLWSVFFQPERHLAVVYLSFMIVIGFFFKKISPKIVIPLIAITACVYLAYDVHEVAWIRANSSFFQQKNTRVFAWIRQHTNKNDIIAARDPYSVFIYTSRPAILIPGSVPATLAESKEFDTYIQQYHIAYVYMFGNDLSNYLTKKTKRVVTYHTGDTLYCVAAKGC